MASNNFSQAVPQLPDCLSRLMAESKIDIHAHFLSPTYHQALTAHGYLNPDGMPGIPEWSIESHLAYMDANGIEKSILSVSSPGTNFTSNGSVNRDLTQESNDFAATVKARLPSRFGYFASLPLPDYAASVAEIQRVLEGPVKADGFALLSNTSGLYLGDPILRPILADLDARKAVVFVHPTSPCQHGNGGASCSATERYVNSAPLAALYRAPLFEFFFDSGRSVLDLLMSGSACRFPHIRWILTHCGGVLPPLVDRIILVLRLGQGFTTDRDGTMVTEQQIMEALRKQFWFDLAGNPVPNQVDALLKFTGKEQLLFGSDVPWTPFEAAGRMVEIVQRKLPACVGRENLEMVYRANAERLLSS